MARPRRRDGRPSAVVESPALPGPPPVPDYVDRDPRLRRFDNNTAPRAHPVVARAGALARSIELHRYGTAWGGRLKAALAERYGLSEGCFLVGPGSDAILDAAARAYLGPGRLGAMLRPGYELHANFVQRTGARLREIHLDGDLLLPADPAWRRGIDALFLASPHNPTGQALGADELTRCAEAVRGLVVVDEAYAEYDGQDLWTEGLPLGNVLFTRTFSKAWGLAGLRVGYGVGPEELVARLERFRYPFTLGTLSEEIACAALREPAFVTRTVAEVRRERPRLARELARRGFRVLPSAANFLFAVPPVPGPELVGALRARGILIRDVRPTPWWPNAVRFTVGTPGDDAALLAAIDAVVDRGAVRADPAPATARRRRARRR